MQNLDFSPTLILRGSALYKWYFPSRMQPISHWQKRRWSTRALVSQTTGPLAPICSRLSAEDMSGLWLVSCQGLILNVRPLWCDRHWTTGTHPFLKGRFHHMYHVCLCFMGLWCVQMCFILTSHTDSLVQMCSQHGNLTWCTSIGVFARLSGGQQRLLIELIWRLLTSGPPQCSPCCCY